MKAQATLMAHKRETVFGKKSDVNVGKSAEATIIPLTEKDLKTKKDEETASEEEADGKKLDDKKASAKAVLDSAKSCGSEKKVAAEDLKKAEGEAKEKTDEKAGLAKLANKQEAYEKKVATEEKAAAKVTQKKAEKEEQKKAADQAAFSVDLANDKASASKKPMTSDEAWTTSDLGGVLSLS
jgi:membrane protein involved in colicin uptake